VELIESSMGCEEFSRYEDKMKSTYVVEEVSDDD
jgi:hypothetical protein